MQRDRSRTWSARVLGLSAALMGAGVASAQPSGPPPPIRLTLDEAIARGLAASHRLADLEARHDGADAVASQRHAALLPQVAAQAGYMRTNHVDTFGVALPNAPLKVIYPDVPDNYRTRLDVQYPIYTAGRLDALERAARAEAQASLEDLAAARADLRLEITRAYWALVTAGEALGVVDESLARMDAHVLDVRHQLDAGLVPPDALSSAEAQRSRQRMLTIQARATREIAESDLARLVGLEPGAAVDPAAVFEPPQPEPTAFLSLVADARDHRPERTALTRRIGAATDRVNAASAGVKPVVAAGGGVDYARPNPRIFPRAEEWKPSWDASVNLTWSLFDGGRVHAEVAEASALRRSAQARLADFDNSLTAEVRQRTVDLNASLAAVDAAADAIRAAEDARRAVGDRFKAGVATSTDVLDAQVALLQARLDRVQAVAAARLAEARLARALGR